MKTAVDISLYPLVKDYESPILDFIARLKSQPNISLATNELSTQISGEYDDVMRALTEAMRPTIEGTTTCSFVLKILNVEIAPGRQLEV